MPVPTDTLWNIKKLNWVFAFSSIAMMATFGWAIFQDYNKEWRRLQKEGKQWQAVVIDEKGDRFKRQRDEKRLEAVNGRIEQLEEKYGRPAAPGQSPIKGTDGEHESDKAQVVKLRMEIDNYSLTLNNTKATLGVMESQLQDARTQGDKDRVEKLTADTQKPAADVKAGTEQIAAWKTELEEVAARIRGREAQLDELKKERKRLMGDLEALAKSRAEAVPDSMLGRFSAILRRMPLLQFMNPAERVYQVPVVDVQMDLSFTKTEVIDRCTTCHINIDKREFSRKDLIEYLEDDIAAAREYRLPANAPEKADEPQATQSKPGAVALLEFWHHWGWDLKPMAALAGNRNRANTVAGTVGKGSATQPVRVAWGGRDIDEFKFNPDEKDAKAREKQDAILIGVMRAWYEADRAPSGALRKPVAIQKQFGGELLQVNLAGTIDQATYTKARVAALKYPEIFRNAIVTQFAGENNGKTALRLLDDKYRHALTDAANEHRSSKGKDRLSPSAVFLAHPRLELYAEQDSPHPVAKVGCTSCHDGSGNETDFVLAGHRPNDIWVDYKTGEPVFATQLINPPKAKHEATMSSALETVWHEGAITPAGVASSHISLEHNDHANHAGPKVKAFTAGLLDQPPHDATPVDYIDKATGQKRKATSQAAFWKKYEPESGASFHLVQEFWEFPMHKREFIQANCARCHNDISNIADEAPVLHEGRALFAKVGCVNCHQMDSITPDDKADPFSGDKKRVGTDLRHIDAKLSPAFINSWIWAPKAFRPSTMMPHFFLLENNSSDEEIRRTRLESRAITEYLLATANKYPVKGADGKETTGSWQAKAMPAGIKGEEKRGAAIFQAIGCMACHTNANDWVEWEDEEKTEPTKRRAEKWIVTDLVQRTGIKDDEAKSIYEGMNYNQRQWYMLENFGALSSRGGEQFYADGKTARPVFLHHGPELSGIGDKLAAGRTPEQARAWLSDWLKQPRHYSAYTAMPSLRLDDQQTADLVEYLLAQKRAILDPKDTWKSELFAVDQPKLNELVAFFLRSQYSPQTADKKAVDTAEMKARATDALTAPSILPADKAAAEVAKMDLQKQQLLFLGKKLVGHYGCFNCHAINGTEQMASPCANLSDWGQKMVTRLAFEYLDPHKVHDMEANGSRVSIAMVNGLSAGANQFGKSYDERKFAEPVAKEVKPAWPHLDHSRNSWIEQKLRSTRIYDRGKNLLEPVRKTENGKPVLDKDGYPVVEIDSRGRPYDKLKMPTFYLNDQEIHAITTFVISNRAKLISPRMLNEVNHEQSKRLAMGRQIAERYNCVSCHTIDKNWPAIQQFIDRSDMSKFWLVGPPDLHGEGSRIQHHWLFNFLKNVEPLRPQMVVRMPSFPLSDVETTGIAAYFAALSQREAKWLNKRLEPVEKYVKEKKKAATRPTTNPTEAWPGDDWYASGMPNSKAQVETWMSDWDRGNVPPASATVGLEQATRDLVTWGASKRLPGMATINFEPATRGLERDKVYRSLLFSARYLARLSDAPYPLVDSPRPEVSDEVFKRGEEFFVAMECMKCHVMAEPRIAATFVYKTAEERPNGPNLTHVYRRLQWRWVDDWVQQTNVILPVGSPMLPFFDGLPAWKLDGLPFGQDAARIEDMTPEKQATVKAHMAKFGATAPEQKELLLNYLYSAGVRNHTLIPAGQKDPRTKTANAFNPAP